MADDKIANPRYVTITSTFSGAEAKLINEWIERQDPKPRKSVAVRDLVLAGLKALGPASD